MTAGILKGRAAITNRDGRYEPCARVELDDGWDTHEDAAQKIATTVTEDTSRSVIVRNTSPDVPFEQSVNPYRGCEHGCIYCFARPTHAFLGLSPGLDFETRLFAKPKAPSLLLEELSRPNYRCSPIAMGTNTDPYQPVERNYGITRGILQVLSQCGHPVSITTKSGLIERDIDILAPMARRGLAHACVSITTLDSELARKLEPRAAAPRRRIQIIRRLVEAGIPTGALVAPVIPILTDQEMESILQTVVDAGSGYAGYVLLRLPLEVKDLFKEWLAQYHPLKAEHVMSVIRQSRQGKENDATFGRRKRGTGVYADLINKRFRVATRKLGLDQAPPPLDVTQFCPPQPAHQQLSLFDG